MAALAPASTPKASSSPGVNLQNQLFRNFQDFAKRKSGPAGPGAAAPSDPAAKKRRLMHTLVSALIGDDDAG